MSHRCVECDATFCKPFNLRRHQIDHHSDETMDHEYSTNNSVYDGHDVFGSIPTKYSKRESNDNISSGNDTATESDQSNHSKSDDEEETETKENDSNSETGKYAAVNHGYHSNYLVDKWIQKSYRAHVDEALELLEEMRNDDENEDLDYLKKRIRKKLLPKYRKNFRAIYRKCLLQMDAFQKNPVHKRVMKTVKKLQKRDGLDRDEAIRKALTERKHLVNRLVSSDSEQSSDSESPSESSCEVE